MFTVTWTLAAEDDLAFVWLHAESSELRAITDYSATLTRHLRANADRIGESREPGVRVLAEEMLGVEFLVSVPDRLVTVFHLWKIQ
jgi:hypothetical protein